MEQQAQRKEEKCITSESDPKHFKQSREELKEENKELSKKVEILEQRIKELETQICAKDRTISWDAADIRQKVRTLAKLQDLLATQNNEMLLLQQSKSFRIGRALTYPLRVARQILHPKAKPVPLQTGMTSNNAQPVKPSYTPGVINLGGQLLAFYGKHRCGWGYAIMHLAPLNHYNGIFLDTFIERTFVWQPEEIQPILKPWIGFIHVPPNMPDWFHSEQTNDAIFASKVWQESYPHCRGLFTLSKYHKKNLENKLTIPINSLLHPTGTPSITWNWEMFEKNPQRKIVQVGWWLRKLHAIFELPKSNYEKIFLSVGSDPYFNKIFQQERELRKAQGLFNDTMYDTAITLDYLPDDQYDQLLSENIMFADLYDSSANNLVIECIVRNAPLLINPLEPVIEYLGKEYPFYFTSYEEAIHKANDLDMIRQAHEYLKSLPIKEKLTGDYFLASFKSSEIFKNL